MNALFVNACIRENSRTKILCDTYIQKYWPKQNMDVNELKVYQEPLFPLDRKRLLQRDNDIAYGNLLGEAYRYAREFAKADEILIGAPYWDCFFPAFLKLYLEQICVNGITFQYGENGCPIKLCACKKLIYITTVGGFLPIDSSLELYIKELCRLFCIPKILFIKADGLDIQGNDSDKIIQETIESISIHPNGFCI